MCKQLEWKLRSVKRSALALGFCSIVAMLSTDVAAVESDESPRPAQPTTSAAVVEKKKALPSPDIAGADLAEKADAKADDDDNAAVVDVGDGQDVLPQSKGKWAIGSEESVPASAIARTRARQPIDPEWERFFPRDDASELSVPKIAMPRPSKPRLDDPERQPRWAFSSAEDGAPTADHQPRRSLPIAADEPRYPSGGGLDSDAAEIVSNIALAEKESDKTEKKVADVDPQESAKPAIAPTEKEKDPLAEELIAKLKLDGGAEKKTAAKKKNGKNKEEPQDPEARFNALIEQIARNKRLLELASKKAQDQAPPAAPEDPLTRRMDPHSKLVLDAMKNNVATCTVTGTITDATGKQLSPARVRIVDQTETLLDSPLNDGFWCDGRFSRRALSGAVKVEVHRGRFCAPQVAGFSVKPDATQPTEFALNRPATHMFATQGWHLADLNMGLRLQPGERPMWLGQPPELRDLLLAAQAEGVSILGVPLPQNDPELAREITDQAESNSNVLVLPAFAGPRHALHGTAFALGVQSWLGLPAENALPEIPLRESFDDIHARGGLAVFNDLRSSKAVDLRRDVLSLLPRLEQSNYFGRGSGNVRLYGASELAFDTITGPAYDAFAFDGSKEAEKLWFNLLNHDYSVAAIGAAGGSLEGGRIPYGQTFIYMEGKPTRDKVLAAIKQGRTSISFGPAAFCKIVDRDKGPGDVLPADGRQLTLQVKAYASMLPGAQLDKVEIIRNGEVVHSQTAAEGEAAIHGFNWPVSETASAWYMVRVTERMLSGGTVTRGGTAWTSPIYFRGTAFAAPVPVTTKITGQLHLGLTPIAGTVTAMSAGQKPRQVATDEKGRFSISVPASGSLIFAAENCEPQALRVFEHPSIQRALGALTAETRGPLAEQLASPILFPTWKLLLSELVWDITLIPTGTLIETGKNDETFRKPVNETPKEETPKE